MSQPNDDYQAFRLTSGRVTAMLLVALGLVGAIDIVLRGDVRQDAAVLLVVLAIMCVSYVLGLRPAVLEEIEALVVRNPLRTARIPWGAVDRVDVTDVLRVRAGELVVRCFAVPRRRPSPARVRSRIAARDYGFPTTAQAAPEPGPAYDAALGRAEGIAARLRDQAERRARDAAAEAPTMGFATDAIGALVAAALLVLLAVLI